MRDDARTAHQLVSRCLDDDESALSGPPRRLPNEVGLTDAGLPLEQQYPADSDRSGGDQFGHRGKLGDSSSGRRRLQLGETVVRTPQVPALREPLQPEAPPVNETNRRDGADQLADDVGHQHLTTRRSGGDARRGVDRRADWVRLHCYHFARVDPDTHARRRPGKLTLRGQRERHGLTGRSERDQEPVTR